MDESSIAEVRIILRDFNPDTDTPMIFATWRNSAFYGVPRRTNDAKAFFKHKTKEIKEILKTATVRMACHEEDPMTIVGYSVVTGNHLDWIYVKVDYRMKGIGSLLMPKNIETVTDYVTTIGDEILKKKNIILKEKEDGTREATNQA